VAIFVGRAMRRFRE